MRAASETAGRTQAERTVPGYPEDCRRRERSGVRGGDPLDVALIRTDNALGRANARVTRCAAWYDKIRDGFAGAGT